MVLDIQGKSFPCLERVKGLEPLAFCLASRCSTNWATPAYFCGERRIRTFEGFSRQIYSLIPLTAWVSPPGWSWQWDSNPQPADYKSAALPTELHSQILWAKKDSNLRRHTSADLQSAAIDRSAISPTGFITLLKNVSHRRDSTPRPTDYKSVALPAELHPCIII